VPIRFLLLRILSLTPMHGYALRHAIDGMRGIFASSNPNLYAILQTMEDEGLVESKRHEVQGRLRKVYSTTETGVRAVESWLSDPVLEPPQVRDEAVMRVSLLDDSLAPRAAGWLENERDQVRQTIDAAEAKVAAADTSAAPFLGLAIDYAVDVARLRLCWLDRVIEALPDGERPREEPTTSEPASLRD
jgi:DNA-binding PadR family transcriptional regulator